MELPDDSLRCYKATLAAVLLLACIGYLVAVGLSGIETEVMKYRFGNAEDIFSGSIPATEYPPLALLFIAIPRLFADTPFGYNVAFVAEMFLFMLAGLIITSRLAAELGRDSRRAMLLYTVLTLLMLEFVLDRFDMIPAVMTLAALYLFVTGRMYWAFALLALGTLTKLYPALLFPVLFLFLAFGRRWNDLARGTVAFAGVGAAAVVLCLAVDPELITAFLGYHGDRPLQLESVASSVIYLMSMFGLADVRIQSATEDGSFLSDNLVGPLPDAVAGVLMPVMVAAILAVCALYAWRRCAGERDEGMRYAALAMLGCLMAFMVFNKVFSSQYLIWIIPSLIMVCLVFDGRTSGRMTLAALLLFVLTQVNFAYNIGYLGGGANIGDLGMMVVLVRNIVAVYIFWLCIEGILLPDRRSPVTDRTTVRS